MPGDTTVTRVAWLLPVLCAAIVYAPILGNYFHADDFLDLYQLHNDTPAQYLLRMYGGHILIARNAITALLATTFGPNPVAFFVLALATHLTNVALLYWAALRLGVGWRLACVAGTMWGIAPADEGAVGWYAVYGQVAATTCILAVLVSLSGAAQSLAGGNWRRPAAWAAAMVLAGMLFGVGIAAALVMPAIAWLLLPTSSLRRRAIWSFAAAAVMLLAMFVTLRALELRLYGEQRVETTLMVLGLGGVTRHVPMLAALFTAGLALWPLGPLTDPMLFPTSAQLIAAACGAVLIGAGFVWAAPSQRRRMAACLLLAAAIYGLIAVARSMFIQLGLAVLARSSRYHYAAGALLSLLICLAIAALVARLHVSLRAGRIAFAGWLIGLAIVLLCNERRIDHYDGDRRSTVAALADIQRAIDATPRGDTAVIPVQPFGAVGFVNFPYRDRFPGTAALFAVFYPDNVVDGHPVVFTSSDPLTLRGARGRRAASLLQAVPDPAATPGAAAARP